MRLAHIELYGVTLPYRHAVTWSDTAEAGADYVVLRVEDSSGFVGVAEATVKPTWSGHTTGSIVAVLREVFVPLLRQHGSGPALSQALTRVAEQSQARGLVETALLMLDLSRDREAGVARRLPVSLTLTRQPPPRMAAEAAEAREQLGIGVFKIKGGQGVATDVAGALAVRDAVPDARLYVDANGAYAAADVPAYAAALRDAGVALLEDPCVLPLLGFEAFAASCPLPLLVDSSARDADAAACFARAGAHAISAKPGRYGVAQALAVVQAAGAAGRGHCVGLFGESALGTAINLHGMGACPGAVLPAELSFFLTLSEQVLDLTPTVDAGQLVLPAWADVLRGIRWSRLQRHALH